MEEVSKSEPNCPSLGTPMKQETAGFESSAALLLNKAADGAYSSAIQLVRSSHHPGLGPVFSSP